MSQLKKIEEQLERAPSIKAMLQIDFVQERFIANYQATTGKTDGPARFQSEAFAYMEIISEKPDLAALPKFQHFAAIIKAGTTGLSFRDNKLYVMPGKNKTIKVQSSPAGKREMMENMRTVKRFPEAQIVLKGDLFIEDKLNGVVIKHETTKETAKEATLDNIVCAYQRIYWADGTVNDIVVPKADLLKAKAKSPAQSEASFWAQWPGEACKKVATNRAYSRHHKYPDNLITYGVDSDKEEEATVDAPHEVVQTPEPEPIAVPTPEEPTIVEPQAEPVKVVRKGSNMASLMDE